MTITHLRYVILRSPDIERSRAFFTEAWGLEVAAKEKNRVFFRTGRAEPFQLALVSEERRGVDLIGFGVRSSEDVDQAARDLAKRGVEILAPPHPLDLPGGGYGFCFRDPDGRPIALSSDVAEEAGTSAPATPLFLAHVVLNTPDIDRATSFYTDVLGFRISDWSEHVMSFLRCDQEHHAVALNAAPHASLNHTAWQMRSIDELFRAQGRVRAAGVPLKWGTGRHAPGEQVFNYFIEPSGYVVEYIADGLSIDDESNWRPQVFGREPAAMDLWNTSGPPSAEIRSAMLGSPDDESLVSHF